MKRRGVWLGLLMTWAVAAPALLNAQVRCDASVPSPSHQQDPAQHWGAPLDRPVTIHAGKVTLRSALEQLANVARIRLSYSADLLPLGEERCATYDSAPVGEVLTHLLAGSAVEAVVAGKEHVVLAPARNKPAPQPATITNEVVVTLPPVVVGGEPHMTAPRSTSIAMDVIDGRKLAQQSVGSIADAINAAVPGFWVWPGAGSSLSAQYGSMRGASSFGPSYPKVFIDGIEVANPLLLTRFSPESIERIEIIRGPEGAALYGADAINGVTNIVTRNDGFEGGPRMRVRTDLGIAASSFASSSALSQDHTLSLRAGSAHASAGLNLAFGSVAQFLPGGDGEHLSADGTMRFTTERTQLTGTLRFFNERAGRPMSPGIATQLTGIDSLGIVQQPQTAMQYTAGVRAFFTPNERWTHSITVGVDGYSLDNSANEWTPFLSAFSSVADSALRAVSSGVRGTFRFSSTARFVMGRLGTGAFTVGADHSALHQIGTIEDPSFKGQELEAGKWTRGNGASYGGAALPPRQFSFAPTAEPTEVFQELAQSNTGFSTQLSATFFQRLSLTGGVRVERQLGGGATTHFATLPMASTAYTMSSGPVTMKLRAAYGKGIRWPQLPATNHEGYAGQRMRTPALNLAPEQQAGVEAGIDLLFGRSLTLQATRFDQTASGLIQRSSTDDVNDPAPPRLMWENVGEISNRGWEMQARVEHGAFSLTGNLSLVDSRVRKLADGYAGDLRVGDRMLAVPARTVSLTAGVTRPGWYAGLTAYRASDWINYDRIGLASVLVEASKSGIQVPGAQLRSFWQQYNGRTHLRASMSRDLGHGLTGFLTADNLFNYQIGEPDNITIIPGRTISFGLRATF